MAQLLAANTSDPDGDARILTAVDATSANGVPIVNANGFILYSSAVDSNDHFSYTVRDKRAYRPGDTARTTTGSVQINMVTTPVTGQDTIIGIVTLGPTVRQLTFTGVPGFQYVLQFAPDAVNGPWTDLSTDTAGPDGSWVVTDHAATGPARFYRVRTN